METNELESLVFKFDSVLKLSQDLAEVEQRQRILARMFVEHENVITDYNTVAKHKQHVMLGGYLSAQNRKNPRNDA